MASDSTKDARFMWHKAPIGSPGPRTHALVVGTSFYEHIGERTAQRLRLKELDCAASAAVTFASWLKNSYRNSKAPLGTIRLLASASAVERRDSGFSDLSSLPPTTADNVAKAMAAWEADCQSQSGNVALLYVSGHGILESPDQVYVLLQDAFAQENLRNAISIGPTQLALGAGTLSMSVIFVDACQQILPETSWDFGGGIHLVAPRDPRPDSRICAPIYYASSPGGSAFGEAGRGTYFCQALIKCLEVRAARPKKKANSTTWSVSTTSLHLQLPSAVQELAPEQEVRPAGWGRDSELFELAEPPALPLQILITPREMAGSAEGILHHRDTNESTNISFSSSPYSESLPCGPYSLRMVSIPPARFVEQVHHIAHLPPSGAKEDIDLR